VLKNPGPSNYGQICAEKEKTHFFLVLRHIIYLASKTKFCDRFGHIILDNNLIHLLYVWFYLALADEELCWSDAANAYKRNKVFWALYCNAVQL